MGRFRLLGRAPEPPEDEQKSRTSAARLRAAAGHTAPVERRGLSGASAYPTSASDSYPAGSPSTSGGYPAHPEASGGHPATHASTPSPSAFVHPTAAPSAPGHPGGPATTSGSYPAHPGAPGGHPAAPGGAAHAGASTTSASGGYPASTPRPPTFADPSAAPSAPASTSGAFPPVPSGASPAVPSGASPAVPSGHPASGSSTAEGSGRPPAGRPADTGYFPVATQPPVRRDAHAGGSPDTAGAAVDSSSGAHHAAAGTPLARSTRSAPLSGRSPGDSPLHTGSFPAALDRVPALVGAAAVEPPVARSGAHHAADRAPVAVGAHTAGSSRSGGFPAVGGGPSTTAGPGGVPSTTAGSGHARSATADSGGFPAAAPSATTGGTRAATNGSAHSTTNGSAHSTTRGSAHSTTNGGTRAATAQFGGGPSAGPGYAAPPPRAGSDGAAAGLPRWADGAAPRTGAGRRYPGDPPTEPFGYPPVAGPAAGARPGMLGPPPLPDRAEASAMAAAFAVDYLSWDEDDLPRRGRVLRGYLPGTTDDPACLGWSGRGRQRAEFALTGRVWPDGEGRVLVDVRVRVTPYRAVGDRRPAPPEPEPEPAGMPAVAPAPTGVGWRSLASCWIRLTVPVVLDGGRLLVDAWEELIGADLPLGTGRGHHALDEPAVDDHALADDDPADEPFDRSLR